MLFPIPTQRHTQSCSVQLYSQIVLLQPYPGFVCAHRGALKHRVRSFQSGKMKNGWEPLHNSCSKTAGLDMQHSNPPPQTTTTTRRAPRLRHALCALNLHCMLLVIRPFSTPLYMCRSCYGWDSHCPGFSLPSFLLSVLRLTSAAVEKDDISPQSASYPHTQTTELGLLGVFLKTVNRLMA